VVAQDTVRPQKVPGAVAEGHGARRIELFVVVLVVFLVLFLLVVFLGAFSLRRGREEIPSGGIFAVRLAGEGVREALVEIDDLGAIALFSDPGEGHAGRVGDGPGAVAAGAEAAEGLAVLAREEQVLRLVVGGEAEPDVLREAVEVSASLAVDDGDLAEDAGHDGATVFVDVDEVGAEARVVLRQHGVRGAEEALEYGISAGGDAPEAGAGGGQRDELLAGEIEDRHAVPSLDDEAVGADEGDGERLGLFQLFGRPDQGRHEARRAAPGELEDGLECLLCEDALVPQDDGRRRQLDEAALAVGALDQGHPRLVQGANPWVHLGRL
jgi:hypothetical protein